MNRKSLAEKLRKTQDVQDTAPHLIIEARAGTGKTTTLVEGLHLIRGGKPSIEPSPQQAAIWKAMQQSKNVSTVCFVAFNKSIATELQQRVPEGCDAMTMHSMGFKAVKAAYDVTHRNINQYRVRDLTAEVMGYEDSFELRRDRPELMQAVEKLVSLCKMNLVDPIGQNQLASIKGVSGFYNGNQALAEIASHYDIDLNGGTAEIFATVPKVLELCKDVGLDRKLDFDDMIWLPIVNNLNIFRYDLLLVDEAQDLNRCQQQLAIKAGRRLILCGDPMQAIYGFAGADSESLSRMKTELECPECRGVGGYCNNGRNGMAGVVTTPCETCKGSGGYITLPLNVTRRCGRAIVREAQKIVPDFEAHETCSDGLVHSSRFKDEGTDKTAPLSNSCYRHYVGDGDMILCRVNAPLVSECFKLLKTGRKATIQGRDVGQGLISLVNKFKVQTTPELLCKLSVWLVKEERKENAKRNPSDARLIALQDKHDCIVCFTEDCETVEQVTNKIKAVFNDNETDGIKLSSVHKAKGLEARRVFILQPEGATIPHPMAKSSWQREQEMNLLYVAITRSIEELVYVS